MNAFGVYVHWPYCSRICPYCDFNVYRARDADPEPLLDAIEADIGAHAARLGGQAAASIFFGGGTPSLLQAKAIARVIGAVERAFGLAADCEITLEANPEDAAQFAEHAAAGVTRFSIGAQAFDDVALTKLGRWHDAKQAMRAIEAAARTRKRVSLDLIYAREGQEIEAWRRELRHALSLPVEHVSLYQLTIEAETAFARRAERGEFAVPDAELAAAFYEATQEVCDGAGFPAYEISNHARGNAAKSRHNLLYWRSQDWIGVGPGAHGRVSRRGRRIATAAHRRPRDYIDAVNENGIGWIEESTLSPEEWAGEAVLMGLRIEDGVDIAALTAVHGRGFAPRIVEALAEAGLLVQDERRLSLTRQGRLLANRIAAELLSD